MGCPSTKLDSIPPFHTLHTFPAAALHIEKGCDMKIVFFFQRQLRSRRRLRRLGLNNHHMEVSVETYQGGGIGAVGVIIYLALIVFFLMVGWKIFAKAGKPGWAIIIPIYNGIVALQIVNRPVWWIILFLIPIVNVVISIIVALDMAKAFGKGTGFGIGLILLGIIFYPILAFGDAAYQGIERA